MSNFKNNIDKIVSKILNEEIENKVRQISEEMGEWTEIEVDEQLKGGQKKIDVAKPKGKITAADFEKLRDAKSHKKEVEERFYYDTEESDGEEMGNKDMTGRDGFHITSRPKMMASFGDDGWYDENEGEFVGDFDFDYDEEEFDDFDSFTSKFGENQRFFAPGDEGRKFFDIYRKKYGPMKIRLRKDMEEAETEEGNAFSGALAKAKEEGEDTFEVDGETYNVRKESRKSSLRLTEDELIDMIEQIVLEQKVKDSAESANISKKSPVGLKKTEDVLGKNKKENDDYAKEVVEKMKD